MGNGEQVSTVKPPFLKRDIVTIPQFVAGAVLAAIIAVVGYLLLDREDMKERMAVMETKITVMEKVEIRLDKIDTKLDDLRRDFYRSGRYSRYSTSEGGTN